MARKAKPQGKEPEPTKNTEPEPEEREPEEPEPEKPEETEERDDAEEKPEKAEETEETEEEDKSDSEEEPSTLLSPPKTYAQPPAPQPTTIERPPSTARRFGARSVTATCNTLVDSTLKFFVGGLHPNTDEPDLSAYFSKYGQVLSAQVMRDVNTGRHRGFGFVTVKVQDNTMSVFKDTHIVSGKRVSAAHAQVDVRAMQSDVAAALKKKIFVGGLSKALNEEMLEEYFSKFGEVEKVTIMRQRRLEPPAVDGTSRGFGFIVFTTEHAAANALKNPTHFVYGNKVDVRAAESRPKVQPPPAPAPAPAPMYPYGMVSSSADMYNASMYPSHGGYDPTQYASMTQQQMMQQYPQYQLMQQQMMQQQMAMAGSYGGYYATSGQAGAANPYAAPPGRRRPRLAAYGPYRGKPDQHYGSGGSHPGDPSMNPRGYRQQPY